jgi:hypothetical protein
LAGRVVDDRKEFRDLFGTRGAHSQKGELDAMLPREILFGSKHRVFDFVIVKEGHNGFDLVAALYFLKSGNCGNPTTEQNALFHHGKPSPPMHILSLDHPIPNNSKRKKSKKQQKRKIPPLSHIWLQMFIMNSDLSKLTFLKWVPRVSR